MSIQAIRPVSLPYRLFHSRLLLRPRSTTLLHSRYNSVMATTAEELNQEIAQQSALLNDLRKQQADAAAVEEVKKKLGELKKTLAQVKGGSKEDSKKKERLLLKTPKVSFTRRVRKPSLKLTEVFLSSSSTL